MAYPSAIDSFTSPSGTSLLTSPDHANLHATSGSAIVNIETTLGTTAGTSVIKNFNSGDFAARINSSNILQQPLTGTVSVTQGTFTGVIINNSTLGTPTIQGTIAVSGTTIPLNIGANLAPTVSTLTDSPSGTIAWNAQTATLFSLTLGTNAVNRTMGTPANATDGMPLLLRVKQNAANTGTIVWPSIFRFSQNIDSTTGTASSWNYYAWRFNGIDTRWDQQGVVVNLSI